MFYLLTYKKKTQVEYQSITENIGFNHVPPNLIPIQNHNNASQVNQDSDI